MTKTKKNNLITRGGVTMVICVMLAVFVWQFGIYVSEGYAVRGYEEKARLAGLRHQELGKSFFEKEKLNNESEIAGEFGMVKTESSRYLTMLDRGVAVNQ